MRFPNLENENRESRKLAKAVGKHWDVLTQLYEGEKYAEQLAKALGKKLPAISKATKELIDSGLIKVRYSPQSRGGPRKYYSLTERGRAIVEVIRHGKVPEREEYTEAEVKMLVAHAMKIRHSILSILKPSPYSFDEKEYDQDEANRWMPNLISHLKTGYREVYELYEKCEELKRKAKEKEDGIKEEIEKRVREEFGVSSPSGRYKEVIIGNLRYLIAGYSLTIAEDGYWEYKDGEIIFGGASLGKGRKEDLERARKFMFEMLEELKEDYKIVIKLESELFKNQEGLKEHLEEILKQIDSGIPLRGHCDICKNMPKVRG